jgi:hypothetical protein
MTPVSYDTILQCATSPHRCARRTSIGNRNGSIEILLGVGIVVVATALVAEFAPVFGLIDAATLLFVGVFNYVAYRDVFERRSDNAPLPVAADLLPGASARR